MYYFQEQTKNSTFVKVADIGWLQQMEATDYKFRDDNGDGSPSYSILYTNVCVIAINQFAEPHRTRYVTAFPFSNAGVLAIYSFFPKKSLLNMIFWANTDHLFARSSPLTVVNCPAYKRLCILF